MRVSVKRQLARHVGRQCGECLLVLLAQVSQDVFALRYGVKTLVVVAVSGEQVVKLFD